MTETKPPLPGPGEPVHVRVLGSHGARQAATAVRDSGLFLTLGLTTPVAVGAPVAVEGQAHLWLGEACSCERTGGQYEARLRIRQALALPANPIPVHASSMATATFTAALAALGTHLASLPVAGRQPEAARIPQGAVPQPQDAPGATPARTPA